MNKNRTSVFRWPLMIAYMGGVLLMLACMTLTAGFSNAEEGILQIDNGIIKVSDENGDRLPLAGDSTFELVGSLESFDPWIVAGRTLETNESTQVEEGLQPGDLVRVRGAVLEDNTWLAYSIEKAQEQPGNTITLIGRVTSINPWVVNGITLNVTDETIIEGEITPGILVRVEILLLEDGTWEVISIAPLGDLPVTNGCATVIATVVSVNGEQIQFLGWPTTVKIGGDSQVENENSDDRVTVSPGQVVLVVVCVSGEGQIVIMQITVLDDDDDDTSEVEEKVLMCHKPSKNAHTLSISSSAVQAHLGHGDTLGPCP